MPSVESYITLHSSALGLRFSKTHLLMQPCVKVCPVFSWQVLMNSCCVKDLSFKYSANFMFYIFPKWFAKNPNRNYTAILDQMKIIKRRKYE